MTFLEAMAYLREDESRRAGHNGLAYKWFKGRLLSELTGGTVQVASNLLDSEWHPVERTETVPWHVAIEGLASGKYRVAETACGAGVKFSGGLVWKGDTSAYPLERSDLAPWKVWLA